MTHSETCLFEAKKINISDSYENMLTFSIWMIYWKMGGCQAYLY